MGRRTIAFGLAGLVGLAGLAAATLAGERGCVSTSEAVRAPPGSPAHRLDRLQRWGAQERGALVRALASMIERPSVARDPAGVQAMAADLRARLQALGMRVDDLAVDGPPLLLATGGPWQSTTPTVTLLLYAHYDGQNVDATRWRASEPFTPTLYPGLHVEGVAARPLDDPEMAADWRLYGRAAADDKGPIAVLLHVLKGIHENALGPTAIGVKILLDGEEESGSPHLGAALARLDDGGRAAISADALVSLDGPLFQSGAPTLSFGVRGIMALDLTTYGAHHDLHSGHYGNWAPNPGQALSAILASLHDPETGRVRVPGFYDCRDDPGPAAAAAVAALPPFEPALADELGLTPRTAPWSLMEALTYPSLNIRGLRSGDTGDRARTVIPARADAALDIRLVPSCTRAHMERVLRTHLEGLGYTVLDGPPDASMRGSGARQQVVTLHVRERGYPGVRTPVDAAVSTALREIVARATGETPVLLPTMGGSLPFAPFHEQLGMHVLALPLVNHDNNQHGPDENVRLGALWRGFDILAAILLTYPDRARDDARPD